MEAWAMDNSNNAGLMSCGYSPLAIVFLLVAGYTMFGVLVGSSFRRLKTGMPAVASCSAGIAAACHLPEEEYDDDASLAKLQWGETQHRLNGIRHCAFSQLPVNTPAEGKYYI